jgi:hypothetical protein
MIDIGKKGWRREEPEPISPEKSSWLEMMLTRALAEGVITPDEARNIGGEVACKIVETVMSSRAAFLRLPLEQRRKILEDQAHLAKKYYSSATLGTDLETGEIDNHESQ